MVANEAGVNQDLIGQNLVQGLDRLSFVDCVSYGHPYPPVISGRGFTGRRLMREGGKGGMSVFGYIGTNQPG